MRRFSVATLLGVVGVTALGLAAMRQGSQLWLEWTYAVTLALLFVGLLGGILRTRPDGAWQGFALFGWGFFLMTNVPAIRDQIERSLPTEAFFNNAAQQFHEHPVRPSNLPSMISRTPDEILMRGFQHSNDEVVSDYAQKVQAYHSKMGNSRTIGMLLSCLLLGLIGSVLGRILAARRA